MQLKVRVTDHKCGIGSSLIFDTVFQYLPIFPTVLRYWVPPKVPLPTSLQFVPPVLNMIFQNTLES